MKSYRNKLKQQIMGIQDRLIKSIKVKNQQATLKDLYIVIQIDANKWIGSVQPIPFGSTALFQQFETVCITTKQSSNVYICLWNYESVKQIQKIKIPTKIQHNPMTIKSNSPNIQIQIYFQSQTSNSNPQQYLQESYKNPKFSLPSLKQRHSKMNSPKLKHSGSNQTSAALYPSQQFSQHSLVNNEKSSQNDTSLEKIMTNEIKIKDYNFKSREGNNYGDSIKLLENKNYIKDKKSKNLFDDYEARPRQISNKTNFQLENTKQAIQKQKIPNGFNSTTSSSTVKKNLLNMISILTKKTQKAGSSKINSFHLEETQNSYQRNFFDYGLKSNKKIQQNQKLKDNNQNYGQIKEQKKLEIFYEKHLTKKQIEKVAKMSSFELSKSIFQQYGLDLSLTKIYSSKQFERKKSLDPEKQQAKQLQKNKNSVEIRKGAKKVREKRINEKNSIQKEFEDYGESLFGKQTKSSKSLRRMEIPK